MAERVLVTGGAGYVGSHVVLALLDAGHEAVVVDDLSTGLRELVPERATFIAGDSGDAAAMEALLDGRGITAVMHLAASSLVHESVAAPLKYYRNNTAGSLALIAACLAARVTRFVFSSTAAVYGHPDVQPISEDAPTVPINPYGASKLATETMLRDTAAAHGLSYVALRYFNVAGADPRGRAGESTPNATHLIKVASEVAAGKRDHIDVYGDDYDTPDGTCVRDYIHVADIATAHLAALGHLMRGGESLTLNCGYGHGYSVRQVLAAVDRVAGRPIAKRDAPRRPGDPPTLVAEASRIRHCLDWRPRHDDLDFIIRTALEWERGRG